MRGLVVAAFLLLGIAGSGAFAGGRRNVDPETNMNIVSGAAGREGRGARGRHRVHNGARRGEEQRGPGGPSPAPRARPGARRPPQPPGEPRETPGAGQPPVQPLPARRLSRLLLPGPPWSPLAGGGYLSRIF